MEGLPIFVDRSVFEQRGLDISSGDPAAGLELDGDDLKRLIWPATVGEIAKAD
jgi:prolyl-tRNA editing enzyme YbaK/EbsC (Cys-tRNA(Pro) deacylase)